MTKKLLLLFTLLALSSCARDSGSSEGSTSPTISVVNNRAFLSWQTGSGLPDGYRVEQSSDGVSWNQILTVTETSTYVDGLTSGNTYYFRVRSFNSAGPSGYSGTVTLIP